MKRLMVVLLVVLAGCGAWPKIEKPRSMEDGLAYTLGQCTQVRVDALNFAAAGRLSWENTNKAQKLADACVSTVAALRAEYGPVLGCLLPVGERPGDCPSDALSQWVALNELLLKVLTAIPAEVRQ